MAIDDHRTRRAVLGATAGVLAGLAGCIGGDDDVDVDENDPDGGLADEGDPEGGMAGNRDDAPAWMTETLTDETTGEEFSIIEAGRPVILHTFETWCTVCRSQHEDLDDLYEERGDELLMVDLNIDQNYDTDDLVEYAEDNGHEWRFGIAPGTVMSSLIDDFGQEVSSAPSAPVILVCPDGAAYKLGKGISAESISETIDDVCA